MPDGFRRQAGLKMSVDLRLEPPALLDAARERVELDDFGDPTLPIRLEGLCDQLLDRLDERGQACACSTAVGLLVQRLELLDSHRRYSLSNERIERPVIVFGEGRSGTTVLQMLLGCDDDARLLEFWEVMRPSPPPGLGDVEERQKQGDADWREILDLIPQWLVSHPYNALLGRNPPECERLWAMDFRALPPTAWWRVPVVPLATPRLTLPRDDTRQLEIHRMMLQNLQYRRPPRRWVLKGVSHQHRLGALLTAYPDAIYVWIHRDPLQAIASRFVMHAQIFEGIAGRIDRDDFAAATVDLCVSSFREAAENPLAGDPRIHHLLYEDFIADPVASIRELYDAVGIDFTPHFEESMRRWLADNPSGRYGRFEYSVDALGVDMEELDRSLDPYRDRFQVPRERVRR